MVLQEDQTWSIAKSLSLPLFELKHATIKVEIHAQGCISIFEIYKDFIEEKSVNLQTAKSYYTHQKVRSAYRSLRANLPHLFIRKKYKKFEVPNTTNTLDGGTFSPLKILIKIHRGLGKSLKLKIVDDYLINYKKK